MVFLSIVGIFLLIAINENLKVSNRINNKK